MFLIGLLFGLITLFYVWLKHTYSYWKRNKVPGPEPTWFIGNIGSILAMYEHTGVVTTNWYKYVVNFLCSVQIKRDYRAGLANLREFQSRDVLYALRETIRSMQIYIFFEPKKKKN